MEKKAYSTKNYLDDQEFETFSEFLKAEGITSLELANIEAMGRTREAMNARIRKKRILRAFANKVLEAKRSEAKAKEEKFKNLEF